MRYKSSIAGVIGAASATPLLAAACVYPAGSVQSAPCASPPAHPIAVGKAERALRAQGIGVVRNSDCTQGATYIVTTLTAETNEFSVFCAVEKFPAPRYLDSPGTIFHGTSVTGKAYELALDNVDCRIYGGNDLITRVRRALVMLGGQRMEAY